MEWQFTLNNIKEIATAFWKMAGNSSVFAFHGQMGAGKTTFIHALCDVKGITDTVGSPTFSIINQYEYFPKTIGSDGAKKIIFHIDLYRLKNEEEALRSGVEDCLYSGNTCLVEWPGNAPGLFPADTVHVHIDLLDDKTRRLKTGNN
ncbi:MAG: tRNA (adenosine(37)-N6)-threonylcarbamoyltransferase complex ATPase subunit type 1 TsaE [Bacteroidota bacterium]